MIRGGSGRGLLSSWNREPSDDSDDQGKGSDPDDRPQRDPDREWHTSPISLHARLAPRFKVPIGP